MTDKDFPDPSDRERFRQLTGRYPGPVEWLTVPGRVLVIITIAGCAGLFLWFTGLTTRDLPQGSYPIAMWILPILVVGFFVFIGTAFAMEKLGVKIFRRRGS